MHFTKVNFHRLHKFVENGAVFTPAQIAAATYKVLIASAAGGSQSYTVPPTLTASGVDAQVAVTFAALGFTPVPGVTYTVQVMASLDGVDSPPPRRRRLSIH